MTTNQIATLDEALIHKDRVDLTKEISYPDHLSIQQYFSNSYSAGNVAVITLYNFNFSMVEIQDICICHIAKPTLNGTKTIRFVEFCHKTI